MAGRVFASGLAIGVTLCVLVVTEPVKLPLLFPDDAFFYFKTANHIAQGAGSTFDGLNVTNGYHPLYMLLLSALAAWVPIQGYTGLYTVIIVDTVFMAIWLWLMTRVGDALRFTSTTSAALAVTVIPLAFNTDFGTEAKLLLPLAWSLVLAVRRVASDETRALRAGLLGAAVCFTRLDAVLFVSCVSAAVVLDTWMNRGRTPSMHIGLRLFGPAAVVLSLYALYNLAVYGHPSTISSWLKFGSRALERSQGASLLHMELHLQAAVAVAVVLALVTVFVAFRRRTFNALLLGALGVWLIAYFGIMITFLRGGMEYWYFTLPLSVAVVLGWAIVGPWVSEPRLQRACFVAALVGGLALTTLEIRHRLSLGWYLDDGLAMASWMASQLPDDARVFQVDNSGVVAYFSNRAVVNGDGLINGWEYQDYLRRSALPAYFARHRITYVIWDEYRDGAAIEIDVPLWNAPAVRLGFRSPPAVAARFGRFILVHSDPSQVVLRR